MRRRRAAHRTLRMGRLPSTRIGVLEALKGLRQGAGVAVLFVAALMAFVLLRQGDWYGDGPSLARIAANGPSLYRNILYLPVAWIFCEAGSILGLASWQSLCALSALAGAAGVALVMTSLAREGLSRAQLLAVGASVATTPTVVFFSTTVEVHTVQLAAAACAFLLARHARSRSRPAASLIVSGAAMLAVAGHATSVLVVPALACTAVSIDPRRGLSRRGAMALAGGLPLACLGLVHVVATDPGARSLGPGELADGLQGILFERGLFAADEVMEFLVMEVGIPLGVLALVPLGVFLLPRGGRGPMLIAGLALLLYVIILPQTGLREAGGYLTATIPPLAIALGVLLDVLQRRSSYLLVALALLGNMVLAATLVRRCREVPGASVFASETFKTVPPEAVALVTSQARMHAIQEPGSFTTSRAVAWELSVHPRRKQPEYLRALGMQVGAMLKAGHMVALDRDLLRNPQISALVSPPLVIREPEPRGPFVLLEFGR